MRRSIAIAFTVVTALITSAAAQTPARGGQARGGQQHRPSVRQHPGPAFFSPQHNSPQHNFPRGGGIQIGGGIRTGGVHIGVVAGFGRGSGRGFGHGRGRGNYGSPVYVVNPYYYGVPVVPYVGLPIYDPTPVDFNTPRHAYTIEYGTGRVPAEYVAPGAAAVSAAYRQGQLDQRITSLADEVARLRAEKESREAAARRRDSNVGESFAASGVLDANTPAPGPNSAATATLVFRNGQRLDIANYAVVGSTLWVFDEQRARRVRMTDLNLDATRKANAENGFELKLPAQK